MTRRVEVIALEEGWLVKSWCKTAAEAEAVQAACQRVNRPEAFMPTTGMAQPKVGIPFDPPEEPVWPSDTKATWYPADTGRDAYPPNCQGNNSAGNVLAHGQFEAAVDGDDCTSGACLITRGSD